MSAVPTPSGDDGLYYEMDALRALAAQVLNEHINDHGTCRACGCAFPCPNACLAEHNLQACSGEPHGDDIPFGSTRSRSPLERADSGSATG